jgi:microcompartment protein CcmK/EutM
MRLARVTGTVTATAKDSALVGGALLVVDFSDAAGKAIETGHVALDSCGAGVGDTVLISQGSAARLPQGKAAMPIDAVIVAIVEQVSTL